MQTENTAKSTVTALPEVPGLQAEVEALRATHPDTRALYQAVCRLLFFSHGQTPTANKLYQLVHKGSMSVPVEELDTFWESLRSLTRVRIDHPDIPDELKGSAGELVSTLWKAAREAADEHLVAYRAELRAETDVAVGALAEAVGARDAATRHIEKLEADATRTLDLVGSLRDTVRARDASIVDGLAKLEQISGDLREERSAVSMLRSAQDKLVQGHAVAVRAVEERVRLAEDRLREQEKRALLEIDRERQTTIKTSKELDAVRASLERSTEQHRVETTGLHKQVADARQTAGVLEGRLVALGVECAKGQADIAHLQEKLTDALKKIAAAASTNVALQESLAEARAGAEKSEATAAKLLETMVLLKVDIHGAAQSAAALEGPQ
jgi:chromosome segregation ATPase